MSSAAEPTPGPIADQRVDSAPLMGDGARSLLAAALAPAQATVEGARVTGVSYRAGRTLMVEHDVRVRHRDGRRTREPMVLATGGAPPPGSLVLSDGERDVVVWRVPADPWLPGMGPALDPAVVRALLEDLGLPSVETRGRVRAYRPGRRAVIEVTGPGVRLFLKVVRPDRAEALHQRHRALEGSVPVPASHGWSAELGIVVLQALPGRTLRDTLLTSGPLPAGAAISSVLDALPPSDLPDPGHGWRGEEFAAHLGAVLPPLRPRVDAVAERLVAYEAERAEEPEVPVHGDLHDAQLLVDGGRIVGLLDVDTYRSGRRVDDLATYVGHLAVLATTSPERSARIERHARSVLVGFDAGVDPALLRAAVAGVILGLATGSFRVQDPGWEHHTEARVAAAERWLDSADQARQSLRRAGRGDTAT